MYRLFVIVCWFAVIDGKGYRCDYKYYASAHGWFKLHLKPEWYDDAKDICKMEGAILASAKNPWVRDIMLMILNENLNITYVFTLLVDDDSDKPVTVYDRTNSTVVEAGVGTPRPFICYYDGPETVALNECGTNDDGYKMFAKTKNCYKFHSNPRNWAKALRTCEGEGGYLAVVNSLDEAEHLTSVQYDWSGEVFMGFSATQDGKWYTVTDVRLSESGYTFGPGQPVDVFGDRLCGTMGRDVRLYNGFCTSSYRFFCEKNPNSLLCDAPLNTSITTTTTLPPPLSYPPCLPPAPPPGDLENNSAVVCTRFGLRHVFLVTLSAMMYKFI